ncbi:MAG TPA: NADPH-dependent glutamate synthase [Chloroflexia bacterium]|nr:NADPH-dependent glutamate synthase [Chloroflexia bacterium]
MTEMTLKERMKIMRQEMPVQEAEVRRANFSEVALGFTDELALIEADRCLDCKPPRCIDGCPGGVLIPRFIEAVRDGDMPRAVETLKLKNNLPSICGRVCPQESQCEALCTVGVKGKAVAIGRLERYVGDWALRQGNGHTEPKPPTGKRVAIVGSGPAGLTCAADLAREGHQVTIFEALHAPGGVLTYGIPEFRLPKSLIQAELEESIYKLGVEVRTDYVIGQTTTLPELLKEYDAVFLGTGAGLPTFMPIPGADLNGVMSANELLTRVNLMKAYLFPEYDTPVKVGKRVVVIGAGNVAMDAARCCVRLQAQYAAHTGEDPGEVHIVYRRSAAEVPARAEEVEHAMEEGVIFDFLTSPVAVLGDEQNTAHTLRCVRMELGEPDESGRRSPKPIEGSEFDIPAETVVFALGTSPNPILFRTSGELDRSRHGTVNEHGGNGRTSVEGVWAGGDVVTGAATVISAMGAGKRAAADMHEFMTGGGDW